MYWYNHFGNYFGLTGNTEEMNSPCPEMPFMEDFWKKSWASETCKFIFDSIFCDSKKNWRPEHLVKEL